jgi:hypothetical protein
MTSVNISSHRASHEFDHDQRSQSASRYHLSNGDVPFEPKHTHSAQQSGKCALTCCHFATACAFFGAALYVNAVEQPARLALDARAMVREWTPSNRRGFTMLALLAIVSAFSAYPEYIRTGDVRWLMGGTIVLASWPYAFFVMIPVNGLLYGTRRKAPASVIRELMREWGLLEWGQTAIGFGAAYLSRVACGFGRNRVTRIRPDEN